MRDITRILFIIFLVHKAENFHISPKFMKRRKNCAVHYIALASFSHEGVSVVLNILLSSQSLGG